MSSGWKFKFGALLSVTVEEEIECTADDISLHPLIFRRMASQKDLFDSQGVNESVNGDGNEEGGRSKREDDMEAIVNAGRQADDYNKVTNSTVNWKEGVMACIVDAMEENLDVLVGHTQGNEYRR